jgi:hypothetical protein
MKRTFVRDARELIPDVVMDVMEWRLARVSARLFLGPRTKVSGVGIHFAYPSHDPRYVPYFHVKAGA